MGVTKEIHELVKGYFLLLKSIFFKIDYKKLDLPVAIPYALLILALLGIMRTILSVLIGLRFQGGVWFSFDFGVVFTMIIFPIFLCFFPAMILDYAFKSWKLKIDSKNVIGLFFYMQLVQIVIPFFDWLMLKFGIHYYWSILSDELYFKLAISPLATTPLIFLVTKGSSLGIFVAWIVASIVVIKYGIYYKVPWKRFLLISMLIFYIIYVITYPTFRLFYVYENNFYYGLTYFIGAIGAILYFKQKYRVR